MVTLENRLEKMEKKLKMYQLIFISFILVGAFIIVTAFNKKNKNEDIIQAREFQVVDEQGRMVLSLKKDFGGGNIKLYDELGNNLVNILKSDAGSGAIVTKDKNGKFVCRVINYDDGSGKFEVYNNGKIIDELGSTDKGGGYIAVKDENGKVLDEVSSTDKGTGFIGVRNGEGNFLFKVTYVSGEQGGWMGLYNNQGKNVFRCYSTEFGARASVLNTDGNEIIDMALSSYKDGLLNVYNHSNYKIGTLGGDASSNGCLNVYNNSGQNLNGIWPK